MVKKVGVNLQTPNVFFTSLIVLGSFFWAKIANFGHFCSWNICSIKILMSEKQLNTSQSLHKKIYIFDG